MKQRSDKKPSETMENLRFSAKLLKQTSPSAFVLILLTALFTYAAQMAGVWLSARMTALISAGAAAQTVFQTAVALAVSVLALSLIRQALGRWSTCTFHQFLIAENKILSEALTGKDYALLEKPDFQQALRYYQTWIENNGGLFSFFYSGLQEMVSGIFGLAFSVAAIAPAIRGLLAFDNRSFRTSWGFGAVTLLAVAVCGGLTAWISDRYAKKNIRINDFFRDTFAQFTYWLDFPTRYKPGKDIRIYGSQNMVIQEYQTDFEDPQRQYRKNTRRTLGAELQGMGAMQGVITAVVYIFVAVRAFDGALTAEELVRFTGCVPIFIGALAQLGNLPYFFNMTLANIGYLRKICEYPTERHMGTLPVEKRNDNQYDIEFRHVSFKYPGTDAYALKDVSLKLKIGEHLAFVGHNGSGKSTFIKLLCRLYDPTEGEITLNGIDIRKYDIDEYMSLFGVVFQDFSLFSVPLSQNVTTSVEFDRKKLLDVLDKAGIGERVQELPHKEDTVLYKDFDEDGVEISGGEAQKLAIARALYRDAPFVVLDEPTAALDPISEFEIYRRFNNFTDGKTAIYISHRLSSCRFCDKIIVFQEGQIVQAGSHEALLAQGGAYSALWHAQAKYYVTVEQA